MRAEYTPVSYLTHQLKIPVRYRVDSYRYDGYHEPFYVSPKDLKDDMEIVTKHTSMLDSYGMGS